MLTSGSAIVVNPGKHEPEEEDEGEDESVMKCVDDGEG